MNLRVRRTYFPHHQEKLLSLPFLVNLHLENKIKQTNKKWKKIRYWRRYFNMRIYQYFINLCLQVILEKFYHLGQGCFIIMIMVSFYML